MGRSRDKLHLKKLVGQEVEMQRDYRTVVPARVDSLVLKKNQLFDKDKDKDFYLVKHLHPGPRINQLDDAEVVNPVGDAQSVRRVKLFLPPSKTVSRCLTAYKPKHKLQHEAEDVVDVFIDGAFHRCQVTDFHVPPDGEPPYYVVSWNGEPLHLPVTHVRPHVPTADRITRVRGFLEKP